MSLWNLGWNSFFENAFEQCAGDRLSPGRIAREDAGRYLVLLSEGECTAELAGRLKHQAMTKAELPAVGDWVALRSADAQLPVITEVLPRKSVFSRNAAGQVTEEQVVAANVDTVFLVSGLDHDFNPRRIERYLTAAWESGASPVIVLNKADLAADLAGAIAEVDAVSSGVPVVVVSALDGAGVEPLSDWLKLGSTIALLGSSGVGKSTLVNALLGEARQRTGSVREGDSRGRHTTTRRELVRVPGGALMIDTPGMRELQLWGDESGAGSAFPDLVELARSCRFSDCGHRTEPGCAIGEAIARGHLDSARVAAWRKLERELAHFARRHDARARSLEKARWKKSTRARKLHPKARRGS